MPNTARTNPVSNALRRSYLLYSLDTATRTGMYTFSLSLARTRAYVCSLNTDVVFDTDQPTTRVHHSPEKGEKEEEEKNCLAIVSSFTLRHILLNDARDQRQPEVNGSSQ